LHCIRFFTNRILFVFINFFLFLVQDIAAQRIFGVRVVPVDSGWAKNSVNAVIFRKNSLVTHKGRQYISYYDPEGFLVVGKRKSGSARWHLEKTMYKGNTADAHNTISMMTDGDGYLHISWDHHNNPLNYIKSLKPGSLEFTARQPMTGKSERQISYPEFYRMKNGDLLFFFRDGASGQGNLVMNRYDLKSKTWSQLHSNLIDGERQRNAYWQACIDGRGTIHLSWVWRETPDVASNHDLGYARSRDGGITWEKPNGEAYTLPINAATAEYACRIPQKSELINQTSMSADASGHPYIATYWRTAGTDVPQYHLIFHDGTAWHQQDLGFRKTAFSLSGAGTKRIPVSRPQVIAWRWGKNTAAAMLFRDEESGAKVSVAINPDVASGNWRILHLTAKSVGSWEPSFDTELWKNKEKLNLFVQNVQQVDAEGKAELPPQMVEVLECDPKKLLKKFDRLRKLNLL
jgi:hypothetical protein